MSAHDFLHQSSASPALDLGHGEAALLTPAGSSSSAAVTVRVQRNGLEQSLAQAGADRPTAEATALIVTIKRNDLPTLTTGTDVVTVPRRTGETPRNYVLQELLHDAGDEWVVACTEKAD